MSGIGTSPGDGVPGMRIALRMEGARGVRGLPVGALIGMSLAAWGDGGRCKVGTIRFDFFAFPGGNGWAGLTDGC